MTKLTNDPINPTAGREGGPPPAAEPDARPLRSSELQLLAFRDLARRIQTDHSVQRYEAALRALLQKPRREPTVRPATNSPES